jgi:hypothetical protein
LVFTFQLVPLHPGVPLVVHAGVAEMADEFWPEVSPYIASLPPGGAVQVELCCPFSLKAPGFNP